MGRTYMACAARMTASIHRTIRYEATCHNGVWTRHIRLGMVRGAGAVVRVAAAEAAVADAHAAAGVAAAAAATAAGAMATAANESCDEDGVGQ